MKQANFIFIMTDTQGSLQVGCYGRSELNTPNLDRLASEGVRFERAYTACPICTPARSTIFSGLMPHFNGAWANSLPFYDTVKSMGQRLADAGYHTAYTGKWHLSGNDYFDTGICPPGWDPEYWYDGLNYIYDLEKQDQDLVQLWRTGLNTLEELKKHNITEKFTWGHGISNRGIEFLKKTHDNPFLLVLSYDEPHGPETCPPEYLEKFQGYKWDIGPNAMDDLKNKPEKHKRLAAGFRKNHSMEDDHSRYFACNSYVDYEIGRVLDTINDLKLENTYVIYTADHGCMLGAHGMEGKGVTFYEETCNIPLLIRNPEKQMAGKIDSSPVSHADLLPTMLDLANLDIPPILDGHSISEHLRCDFIDTERQVFMEWHMGEIDHDHIHGIGFSPARCIVSGKWKFVVNLNDTDELYNLNNDPYELNNLIEDPESFKIRDELHTALVANMYESRDPFRSTEWVKRYWHQSGEEPKIQYKGNRGRPDDAYMPPYRNYNTGKTVVN